MSITALTDAELLDQARNGDEAAFTELYVRHHAAALRLARTYRRTGDPDDLVNGAFERVLGALRKGGGPTESFRAYLFVTLRRLAAEEGDKPDDTPLDAVPEPVGDESDNPEFDSADRALIAQAYESLPDHWQAVLWHTAVEGRQPKELAGVLGVSANAAAAMAYRAREKLRQAYLQAHLLASPAPEHEPYRSQLGAYVRDGLSKRDRAAVQAHLDGCESCRALVAELDDVNRMLVRSVVPLFLLVGGGKAALAAAAGGAAAGGAAAASGSGSSGPSGAGPRSLASKARSLASPVVSVAAIGALVAGLAVIGTTMAREDAGPLNQSADAADIGSTGSDGNGRIGDGDGGSVFGDDDFALSPFDDSAIGTFDDVDFRPRSSRPRAIPRPGRTSGTFPASGSGSGTGGAGTGGAGTGPSAPVDPGAPVMPPVPPPVPQPVDPQPVDPPPVPPPAPAPLGFGTISWTPQAPGTGTLSLVIGERGAAVASVTPLAAPAPGVAPEATADAPLTLHLELTPGARVAAEGLLDRCSAPADLPAGGQTLDCAFDQPPAGGSVPTFDIPLAVSQPDAQVTATILRGGSVEDTRVVALPDFASRLSVTPGWQPTGDGSTGTLTLTVAQDGAWPVGDITVEIGLTGGAGPDPRRPLPAGCTAVERGPEHGVRCTLVGVAGVSRTDLAVPLAVTGEGQKATVRLLLGTIPVGAEVTVELPGGTPPAGT
jgi:RNA polymerase sigma factor (sigma-70 family)